MTNISRPIEFLEAIITRKVEWGSLERDKSTRDEDFMINFPS